MKFCFNKSLAEKYHSNSQISRVLTEDWVERNLYCPVCGNARISKYENNHPVGDFFCARCESDFELKSKRSKTGRLSQTIADGEYNTLISRITSNRNPNFFFMTYNEFRVSNFILIPNHFFTPSIIVKRSPLSPTARRAGWTGCNIDLKTIPTAGKIFIVKDGAEVEHDIVLEQYSKAKSLRTSNIERRGWLMDVLCCVERIPRKEFSLVQIYSFEEELKSRHPDNNFVRNKIRQQLQNLRGKGFVEFLGGGRYRRA